MAVTALQLVKRLMIRVGSSGGPEASSPASSPAARRGDLVVGCSAAVEILAHVKSARFPLDGRKAGL
jgi:hypothetical protein